MKGLFGGILGLINLLGGAILTVLIGGLAWRNRARWARIVIGAFLLGVVVGGVVYLTLAPVARPGSDPSIDYSSAFPTTDHGGRYGENVDVMATTIAELEGKSRSAGYWYGIVTFMILLALEGLRLKLEGQELDRLTG